MRRLALIVAIAENDAIGRAGQVPWSYPEDRAHFAGTTCGHVVVMGRRTWEETGGPLPGRENVVISRTLGALEGARVAPDFEHALELAWSLDAEPFVIGGTRLFEAALPLLTRAFVTRIPESPEADTFFHFDPTGFVLASERVGVRGERYQEWQRAGSAHAP